MTSPSVVETGSSVVAVGSVLVSPVFGLKVDPAAFVD